MQGGTVGAHIVRPPDRANGRQVHGRPEAAPTTTGIVCFKASPFGGGAGRSEAEGAEGTDQPVRPFWVI